MMLVLEKPRLKLFPSKAPMVNGNIRILMIRSEEKHNFPRNLIPKKSSKIWKNMENGPNSWQRSHGKAPSLDKQTPREIHWLSLKENLEDQLYQRVLQKFFVKLKDLKEKVDRLGRNLNKVINIKELMLHGRPAGCGTKCQNLLKVIIKNANQLRPKRKHLLNLKRHQKEN